LGYIVVWSREIDPAGGIGLNVLLSYRAVVIASEPISHEPWREVPARGHPLSFLS
jgi:hypothetical protein